jgi:hypothetical protein
MRHSQGKTCPIALSTSPSSPSCVSAAPRIGLVSPVPHYHDIGNQHCMKNTNAIVVHHIAPCNSIQFNLFCVESLQIKKNKVKSIKYNVSSGNTKLLSNGTK